jgi:hypothetical protein
MALPSPQKIELHDVFYVCGLAVKDALHNSVLPQSARSYAEHP